MAVLDVWFCVLTQGSFRFPEQQSCALDSPWAHQPLHLPAAPSEDGALVAMWVTGFAISGRRVTQPHPHLPVSQPPSGVDVTAALRWTNIEQGCLSAQIWVVISPCKDFRYH